MDQCGPVTFAGNRVKTIALARDAKIEIERRRHHQHQQHRKRAGAAILRRQLLRVEIDRRGEHANVAGQSDQCGNLEGLEGADEDQQDHGKKCRQHQPQRNPPHGLPKPRAASRRSFFQRRIHGAERGRQHEKDKRRPEQRLDENHAEQRINVDHRARSDPAAVLSQ